MTAPPPEISAGAPATPSARKVLIDLLQIVTLCDRSTAGSVVADTVHLGRFTAGSVELYEQAQARAPGAPAPCPRCMGARPPGTSGICRDCRKAMAERSRAREAGRVPGKEIRLAGIPEPTTALPEPTAPTAATPVLDRFDIEDVKRMCSGKRAYPSQIDADRIASRCMARRRVSLRSYACPACGHWHITKSREYRAREAA